MSKTKDELLLAAFHALRSYQYGNASPDLAKEIADSIEPELRAELRLRMNHIAANEEPNAR